MSNTLTSLALQIATNAHQGQTRRDGTTPYINHPMDVAKRVHHLGSDYVAVALLHDVLEDTDVTVKDLLDAGIPDNVVEAVTVLTKQRHEKYDDYLTRVKKNTLAYHVKLADMSSNLADSPTERQVRKYADAMLKLKTD